MVRALLILVLLAPTPALAVNPVPFGKLTSVPGWRKDPFGSGKPQYHRGYDVAVPIGTPVNPTADGTVYYAGQYKGYGNLVAVDHGNGMVTLYGHLSRILVEPGATVTTETVIALSGNTGRSTGPHLHYEIRAWPGAKASDQDQYKKKEQESGPHDDSWVDEQIKLVKQSNTPEGWFEGL